MSVSRDLPRVGRARKLTPRHEQDVARRYVKGASVSFLAGKYDITDGTVYQILERHGVKRRKCGRPPYVPSSRDLGILEFRANGKTLEQIGNYYGLSYGRVGRILKSIREYHIKLSNQQAL